MYMPSKIRFLSVCALMVCGAASLRAQQAQSIAAGQAQPPEVKEFQGYEDQWSTAIVKADQYQLEYLLSPLYVDISATGDVTTRNQQIAGLFQKDGTEPVSMEQKVVSVRTFGDTAIVSGTYIVRWKTSGSQREERGIFTHVYNRQRNHWACVNAQRTAVVDLTPGKEKTQQKSNAPLPFHIPLFHQGAQSTQPASAQNASPSPQN
jgi:ketosteroid isomerase-like protein